MKMKKYRRKKLARAQEMSMSSSISNSIHVQKSTEQNALTANAKLWPTQRSTVVRLGLIRPRSSRSRPSRYLYESSDTFGSSSSSTTNLFSDVSSYSPSTHLDDLPRPQTKRIPTAKIFEKVIHPVIPVSPIIQFDRQEALQALDAIRPHSHRNMTKSSIARQGEQLEYGDQSEMQNRVKNEKSLEASRLILSGHESWVTCADFSNSMILQMKNPKEREEFTELCSQALSVKLETYNRLLKRNSQIYQEQLTKLNNLDRDEYKSHLCKSMLKLINNEKLRQEQNSRNSGTQRKSLTKRNYNTKKAIKQVYVCGGRTIIGEPAGHQNFPNSFAATSKLIQLIVSYLNRDPSEDPAGYRRFKVEVDIKNLDGDQFSIQLYNEKILLFRAQDDGPVIKKVVLPRGVFADKLLIARQGNGPLIIQEPWLF